MDTPALTVEHIEQSGFKRIAFWQYREPRLICDATLPKSHGVYAFSVDDVVMYVGLASRSLAKRLYFYSNPGASQSTNVRLRALIINALRMNRVSIHVATPPDYDWNGLTIRGAEGLEVGIIQHFNLPWNKKGTRRTNTPDLVILSPQTIPVNSSSPASLSTILEQSLS